MDKPSNLLLKLSRRLFSNPSEQERFIEAIIHSKFSSLYSLVSGKPATPFVVEQPVSWQPPFVDRLFLEENLVNILCMKAVITTVLTFLLSLLLLFC
jgi:hypothetical protein